MRASAKAGVMASASVLVGTFCCVVGAMFAGVVVWRRYGKPRTAEQFEEAQATLVAKQTERRAGIAAAVGPVVGRCDPRPPPAARCGVASGMQGEGGALHPLLPLSVRAGRLAVVCWVWVCWVWVWVVCVWVVCRSTASRRQRRWRSRSMRG